MRIENISGINETLIEIGSRIKDSRIAACYTQKDLADYAGVSVSSVHRIEKGQSIQFDNLLSIMKALNLLSKLDIAFQVQQNTPIQQLTMVKKKKIYRPKKVNLTKRGRIDKAGKKTNTSKWEWGE